ncbi:MAG: hypothetical protein M1823_005268 [Watsoniomyces obsoletus]|nr:MAG: hypothetical protein M1823_005268 [Watsoniomyces obsoletus]
MKAPSATRLLRRQLAVQQLRHPARCLHTRFPPRYSPRSPVTHPTDFPWPARTSIQASAEGVEGSLAQTDDRIHVQYPKKEDDVWSKAPPSRGRGGGGSRTKRTLASFSLEGRVGVVTGGARGLGLVMGSALLESGAHLALVDLNLEEAQKQADALQKRFRDENPDSPNWPKVTAHFADVSSPTSVDRVMKDIVDEHGQIDHLVTSAGFTENYDAVSYPPDRMRKLWGVNVDGTYFCAVAVARHLMKRQAEGSIVLIGSMSGAIVNVPQPQAPYNASKAAVRQLAASLAVEWAPKGIRVNCISPGYMMTALTKKILDQNPALRDKWTSLIPQGKLGDPTDLMGAVTFLASDASRYITGADLRVDGGYTVT